MDLITPEEVIRRIEWHFGHGVARYLTRTEARAAQPFNRPTARELLLGGTANP
jgi:hypothetical protein